MIFQKIELTFEVYQKLKGYHIAIPKYEDDWKLFSKIKGEFHSRVTQGRKYNNHCFLFRCIKVALRQDIISKMITKKIITRRCYDSLWHLYKKNSKVILHILEWLCLPLVEIENPDGSKGFERRHINYEDMPNNIEFLQFRDNKAIPFMADILEVSVWELRKEAELV